MGTRRFALLLVVVAALASSHVFAEDATHEEKSPTTPRMVDLGAEKCVPCKKMAPILAEMKADYAGTVDIVFIDVWKNREAGKAYQIRAIPTQVFFDSTGKEVFRHVGFFSRENIEEVFQKKFGITPIPRSSSDTRKEES